MKSGSLLASLIQSHSDGREFLFPIPISTGKELFVFQKESGVVEVFEYCLETGIFGQIQTLDSKSVCKMDSTKILDLYLSIRGFIFRPVLSKEQSRSFDKFIACLYKSLPSWAFDLLIELGSGLFIYRSEVKVA